MALIDKIIPKINAATGLDLKVDDWVIRRTYAGRDGLSAGAWKWFLRAKDESNRGVGLIGSQFTASECAKHPVIPYYHNWGDISIDIAEEPDQ